ncbi:MAG: ATP synthase F0 subunit B [Desulfobacterales bacterium]|nr:ATP synthase F0 subunit B [Desulfobacterales bacterium]
MTGGKRALTCGLAAAAMLLGAAPAAAESGGWRPIYDVVMLWLNFAILVFVLVKVLRRPLRDFFQDKKDELELAVRRIESDKQRAWQRVEEAHMELEENKARLERVRKRIFEEGERERDQLIEDARDQSRIMIEHARRRIDNQIFLARRQFKAEMVDMAVDMALEQLPREVTEADESRRIDFYLNAAS